MAIIKAAFLIFSVAGGLYYICSTVALVIHFRKSKITCNENREVNTPMISVLKPISGIDSGLATNLRSFLDQDYPNYEVLFGVIDPQDPAIPIIQNIVGESSRTSLYIGSRIEGPNNKVRILDNLIAHAAGSILIIADSDTRASPYLLRELISSFADPKVGVVSCIYRGIEGKTIADALEGLHMTCIFAPGVAAAEYVTGVQFALGAAVAVQKPVMEETGGFAAIVDYLADDFQIGYRAAAAGYKVEVSQHIIDIVLTGESLRSVLSRELRWARTTAVSRPMGHAGLVMTFGFVYALTFLLLSGFSIAGWTIFGSVTAVRFMSAYIGTVVLKDREFRIRAWLLPLRDTLSFIIWLAGYMGRTVNWRGRHLQLLKDGRMVNVAGKVR